ncbi:hypothetical protein PPERSA_10693 [Pseudocohnilembus persalinus]|uniref:Malectin domain-containing protein n=1 Tax=Pseudocohnilembus persalinus TaxID=266149 RepID=A0A0V0QDD3_PSEPJ|nr:hypothetical protein PPERSA_10693 [Pseudocohnilembus persalinus]|eukprot:KRX00194.1 hypothetical protein PPERSA_10693 [Pseudocohnilembus persalinus]
MLKSQLILLFLFLINYICISHVPGDVLLAINCGSKEPYTSKSGIVYLDDFQYDNKSYQENKSLITKEDNWVQVRYTKDYDLCKNYRTSKGEFAYFIPIEKAGRYVLTLQMCEVNVAEKNIRVMEALFGQTVIVPDIDIFSQVGELSSLYTYIQFELTEDKEVKFYEINDKNQNNPINCVNAYDGSQLLLIIRSKSVEAPFLNSILLTAGSIQDTDYKQTRQMIDEWNTKSNDITKNKFKKLSYNFKKVYWDKRFKQQDNIIYFEPHYINQDKFNNLSDLLFWPKGLIIIVLILSIVLSYIALDEDNGKDNYVSTLQNQYDKNENKKDQNSKKNK